MSGLVDYFCGEWKCVETRSSLNHFLKQVLLDVCLCWPDNNQNFIPPPHIVQVKYKLRKYMRMFYNIYIIFSYMLGADLTVSACKQTACVETVIQ